MCGTCGCSDPDGIITIRRPGKDEEAEHLHTHSHSHSHDHDHHHHDHGHDHSHSHTHSHHGHSHSHSHDNSREIQLEQDILAHNNLLAERNRGYFEAINVAALNFISSPGAGKTTLLENTIKTLKEELNIFVIEGDQQTMNDADRIEATGVPVIQVNTGSGCHLEANMVNRAVKKLEISPNSILFIENVGNLVCPALFDLGEAHRIVMVSVTEGDDKPAKYPTIFQKADVCIINKADLLPYVQFDVEKFKEYALRVNQNLQFIEVSATTGEGTEKWHDWLKNQIIPVE